MRASLVTAREVLNGPDLLLDEIADLDVGMSLLGFLRDLVGISFGRAIELPKLSDGQADDAGAVSFDLVGNGVQFGRNDDDPGHRTSLDSTERLRFRTCDSREYLPYKKQMQVL